MPKKIHTEYSLGRKGGRSLFEILSDFLVYCKTPKRITDAVDRNKMHNTNGKKYLEFMFKLEMVSMVWITLSTRGRYRKQVEMIQTTEKGLKYIESLNVTKSYLGIQ